LSLKQKAKEYVDQPPIVDDEHTPWSGWQHTPRNWQSDVRSKALDAIRSGRNSIISAVMGAGKSAVIAELCASLDLRAGQYVVITTPTIRLVEQLTDDLAERIDLRHIGQWYTDAKRKAPFIVACMPSAPNLADTLPEGSCALWIADEAHKTECDTIHEAEEALEPSSALGFTATPFRASSSEELSLWDELLYEYTPQDAMSDGVVVPPKLRTYDGTAETVDHACIEMISRAVREGEGPGMVNALTIDGSDKLNSRGAEPFAEDLGRAGIEAEAVHSQKTDAQNSHALERLRRGELDCIVHVNQLAEGANFPWLRWLCLRRPVSSRTRFCQEVGRILRTHEGKEYGLLLDPNDLFSEFGLSYEAVLAGGAYEPDRPDTEAAKEVEGAIEQLKFDQSTGQETTSNGVPVRALSPARAWLRKAKLAFQSVGAIDDQIKSTHWRDDKATSGQQKALNGIYTVARDIPDPHHIAAKTAIRIGQKGDWTKGEMSDLLSILFAVKNDGWPMDADRLIDQKAS